MTDEKQALLTLLNHNLALLTLIGFIIVVIWLIDMIGICLSWWKGDRSMYRALIKYSLPVAFFSLLGSTLTSLFYSDYLGVLPCGLCWFQRVFIYSQVFIFGYAWYKRDMKVWGYSVVLSTAGLIIALYHQYLQMGYSELIPCPAIASTVDCAKPTFMEYGFVTFPFMSVVLFIFMLLLASTVKRYSK
jgi:disulfide bond formation protein DsbB